MPAVDEFIANGRTVEEISDTIGSDRLFYQTLEDLIEVTKQPTSLYHRLISCFNGEYITGDIDSGYLQKLEDARNLLTLPRARPMQMMPSSTCTTMMRPDAEEHEKRGAF